MRIRFCETLILTLMMGIRQRSAAKLEGRGLLRLRETSSVVALFVCLVQLLLSQVLLIDQVVQHLRQRGKTLGTVLDIAVKDTVDDLIQVVEDYLQGLCVLLLENDLALTRAHLSLAVQSMQVKAFRIGALMASEEMRAIFGGSK
jgi:hypothetical protein